MANITMKSLLEAGVHFGHQKRRWNPKMARFIFGERNNIHIIDLQKTVKELRAAYKYIKDAVAEGKTVLFCGTKRQAQESIAEEAKRTGMFYVNHRWLGGMLTNFTTIKTRVERLKYLQALKASPNWTKLSKKEIARLDKELTKMDRALSGIKDMNKLPGILLVIDPSQETTAILEARKLKIPIVAVVDTNCDPDVVDIPVPGNDDAIRAIKLFLTIFGDAILEGKEIAGKVNIEDKEEKKEDVNEEKSSQIEVNDKNVSEDAGLVEGGPEA
ncbi:MAG: 30S ribosomal protein S2 [Elusimicrobiota bacterium]